MYYVLQIEMDWASFRIEYSSKNIPLNNSYIGLLLWYSTTFPLNPLIQRLLQTADWNLEFNLDLISFYNYSLSKFHIMGLLLWFITTYYRLKKYWLYINFFFSSNGHNIDSLKCSMFAKFLLIKSEFYSWPFRFCPLLSVGSRLINIKAWVLFNYILH